MFPVLPEDHEGYRYVTFAKDQPEYIPLPSITDGRHVITKWKLSWREKIQVLLKGNLYLSLLTYGSPLQPIKLSVYKQ